MLPQMIGFISNYNETQEKIYEFPIKQNFIINSFYGVCYNNKTEISRRGRVYEIAVEPFITFIFNIIH